MKIPRLKRKINFKYYKPRLDLTGVKLIIKDQKGVVKVRSYVMDCKSGENIITVFTINNKVYFIEPCATYAQKVCDGRILDGYLRSKIQNNELIIDCIDIDLPIGNQLYTSYIENWTTKTDSNKLKFNYRVVIDEYDHDDYLYVINKDS